MCDCGEEVIIDHRSLQSGATKSCGCLRRDRLLEKNYKHGHKKRFEQTKEYLAWINMKKLDALILMLKIMIDMEAGVLKFAKVVKWLSAFFR